MENGCEWPRFLVYRIAANQIRVPTATGKPGKPGKTAKYAPGREKTVNSVIMAENREKNGKTIFFPFKKKYHNSIFLKVLMSMVKDRIGVCTGPGELLDV